MRLAGKERVSPDELTRKINAGYEQAVREASLAEPIGSAFPLDAVLEEHREMCHLLMQAVDVMRITQRLFDLKDGHILMSKCREIEGWLDAHQSEVGRTDAQRLTWLQDTLTSIGFNSEVNAWGVDFDAPFAPSIRQAIDAAMDALPNAEVSEAADKRR